MKKILFFLFLIFFLQIQGDSLLKLFKLIDLNKDKKIDLHETIKLFQIYDDVLTKGINDAKEAKEFMMRAFNSENVDIDTFKKAFSFIKNPSEDTEPQQIHLSVTGKPTEMVVMWATKKRTATSTVQYGLENLSESATGTCFTYHLPQPHDTDTWLHLVTLRNLRAGHKYQYRVGDASGGWSKTESFKTYKENEPISIGIYGDQGIVPFGFLVQKFINQHFDERPYDMNIVIGDIVYADFGSNGKRELQVLWDIYQNLVEHVAKRVPFMVVSGNHEQALTSTPLNYTAFSHRFRMPTNGFKNQYYSFDYGPIHFISMNTEKEYDNHEVGTPQYRWIENDLIQANRNRENVPWIFFMGHRPMYDWNSTRIQTHIEPLLVKYNVDVGFWGHLHCYFRTYPVINQRPTQIFPDHIYKKPNAPVHIMVGSGGARIHDDEVCSKPKQPHIGFANLAYGFGRLEVYNKTSLSFEFHRWSNGKMEDKFWIHKN